MGVLAKTFKVNAGQGAVACRSPWPGCSSRPYPTCPSTSWAVIPAQTPGLPQCLNLFPLWNALTRDHHLFE